MPGTALTVLLGTAVSIGFIHTLIGPDHYLPFIVMSKARQWKLGRTLWVTLACGIGHVLSSVLIGAIGIAAGIAVGKLEGVEGVRGEMASWLLIGFGLAYCVWGVRMGLRNRPHTHLHMHADGSSHLHEHTHSAEHGHVHAGTKHLTPWVLFVIFVLGPCEPLIPLLMYPAAQHDWSGVALVVAVFGAATIGTMLAVVSLLSYGLFQVKTTWMERYVHALAGGIIAASGLAIKVLGV